MANLPKIDQPELALGQGEIISLLNDILWRMCILLQGTALDIADNAAGGESNGDCYIVGDTPTGSFSTFSTDDIALRIGGGWVNLTPGEGWRFWVQDVNAYYAFNGVNWVLDEGGGGSGGSGLGGPATSVELDGIPDSDHSASGTSCNTFNAGEAIGALEMVYMKNDGEWWRTDASAESTSTGMLAIALEAKSDGQPMNVALPGSFVRDDSWNWTPGATLYVGTATGTITATQPSGSGDVIRVVGFAVTADVIHFNPSPDYITHV